jgi:PleD family two-component response regulator
MSAFKRITVLLAEDHAVVRGGLCSLLEIGNDFKVIQARNGREAVEMAASRRPDVILLNVAMPVINGLQATRQILAANPTAKVIMLFYPAFVGVFLDVVPTNRGLTLARVETSADLVKGGNARVHRDVNNAERDSGG